jgi:hypothetical protein
LSLEIASQVIKQFLVRQDRFPKALCFEFPRVEAMRNNSRRYLQLVCVKTFISEKPSQCAHLISGHVTEKPELEWQPRRPWQNIDQAPRCCRRHRHHDRQQGWIIASGITEDQEVNTVYQKATLLECFTKGWGSYD